MFLLKQLNLLSDKYKLVLGILITIIIISYFNYFNNVNKVENLRNLNSLNLKFKNNSKIVK
jgi:hypothetical protein